MNGRPIVLTDAEIRDVTRKKRPSAQVRALRAMGIAHRMRPDGTVMVLRSSLQDEVSPSVEQESEINWD
jgi:hypothetical protein